MALLQPDKYFSSIVNVNIEKDLVRLGVKGVFIDIDNTIRRRDNAEVPSEVRTWMARAQQAGLKLCLLSNNWHANAPELADNLGLQIVAKALKPLPFAYKRGLAKIAVKPSEAVMIGDQLLTDILGAHLVGMKAYLVQPLVDADLKHTVVIRKFENKIIGDTIPA